MWLRPKSGIYLILFLRFILLLLKLFNFFVGLELFFSNLLLQIAVIWLIYRFDHILRLLIDHQNWNFFLPRITLNHLFLRALLLRVINLRLCRHHTPLTNHLSHQLVSILPQFCLFCFDLLDYFVFFSDPLHPLFRFVFFFLSCRSQ